MLFYSTFAPDMLLPNYYSYQPELLKNMGISLLICDIDNTLVTYDDPEPTEKLLSWLALLSREGIAVAFVSNNCHARVDRFNRDLGCPAYAKSRKPSADRLIRVMNELSVSPKHTALLGDQLLTDVLAARNAHITALAVPPISDKTTAFWRVKRRLERPFIKKYARINSAALPCELDLSTWKL